MNVYNFTPKEPPQSDRQPLLNLPTVIVWLGGIMAAIHVLRTFVLSEQTDAELLFYFAFWPIRYVPEVLASGQAPGGLGADIWSFVTYAFLHGSAMHIIFNLLWMAIFGGALARRFGVARFLGLSAACAVAGALAHLLTNFGSQAPVIGASAIVSGHMAAALRFIFELGGPLGAFRRSDAAAYRVPAVPLKQTLSNQQVIVFIAIWFGLNLVFGLGGTGEGGATVAWQAHIGGFVAGLLLFPLFDPVPQRRF